MTSWFQGFSSRLTEKIEQSRDRVDAARQRVVDNPSDINTGGYPDWATDMTSREKSMFNAVLTGAEKATGRDLSYLKKD